MRVPFGSILLAGLFLSGFGYLWFGVLFQGLQMRSHGYTAADYAGNSPLWYAGGAIISVVIAAGLGQLVRLKREQGALAGARAGIQGALAFGIPLVTFPFVYSPRHELGLYIAGVGHILIGWTIAAALIGGSLKPER